MANKPALLGREEISFVGIKRIFSTLISLIIILLVTSSCVSVMEDISGGAQPIPSKLVSAMSAKKMRITDPIMIRIFKQESELEVWKMTRIGKYALLKTYPICRWSGKLGPKTKTGDRQAPEGFYSVSSSMLNPKSQYNLSFNLGYPNKLERELGYTGEALMVHGACSSSGCFALTDTGVSEIYAVAREALKAGQAEFQVQSFPFRMTTANMMKHQGDPNFSFWSNLKEGADIFEATALPPFVSTCGRKYSFAVAGNGALPQSVCESESTGTTENAPLMSLAKQEAIVGFSASSALPVYEDGGMHPSFRKLLKRDGAAKLAKKTSLTEVPISRPQSALADPY